MKKLLISLSIILITATIYPYSIYNLGYGTRISVHDARASALGETGTAAGFTLFDSFINPANLYYLPSSSEEELVETSNLSVQWLRHLQLNYSLVKNSESRAIPMWNFFDSYIGTSTYVRNEDFYNEFSLGLEAFKLKVNNMNFRLALSYRPTLNFGADYVEEVRNDGDSNDDKYPPIIAKNFLESNGLLNSYNLLLNFGMPIANMDISIGAELSYYTGQYKEETRILWTDVARELSDYVLVDYTSEEEYKLDGMGIKLGLSSQLTERIRLGFSYSPKTKLDYDKEISALHLPTTTRLGLLFNPRNPFKTNFHVDFEYVKNEDINDQFDNGYAFYVGMEHYVSRAIPFRLGFSHKTSMIDRSVSLPTVSVGTGFEIMKNLNLDLSTDFGRREYITLDLFPDSYYDVSDLWGNNFSPSDRGWDNPDKVTESFFKVFLSLIYRL